jgi:hypothetical protein
MHHQRTPEEERAEKIAQRWRETGLAAASEMIEAICRQDELLESPARSTLVDSGERAFSQLITAAADRRCDLAPTIATIVCQTGAGAAELVGMLRARQQPVVSTALSTLSLLAKDRERSGCVADGQVLATAVPALAVLVRTAPSPLLEETLWVAKEIGPLAAPLVPDLIPVLFKSEVPSNSAASALGAIGPKAAAAVPTLRGLLARGRKWHWHATEALGGIGEPARSALPDLVPILAGALPGLCSTRPRYSEPDVIAGAVQRAAVRIGGPGVEPLVPDLVTAFGRMRACNVAGPVEDWIKAFGSFGRYGKRAVPLLLSIAFASEESVGLRRYAIEALDRVEPLLAGGPPVGSSKIREIRRALARKREIFSRPVPQEPLLQMVPPPRPPPRTPRTFALCREEAGLPVLPEPTDLPPPRDGEPSWLHDGFGHCVEAHLCGPDMATYRATIATCCRGYGGAAPWFCAAP